MEMKKSEYAQLGRKRGQFLTVGLIVALSFAIFAFEWKSYEECGLVSEYELTAEEPPEFIQPTVQEIKKPPKPKTDPVFIEVEEDELVDDLEDILIDLNDLSDFNPDDYDVTPIPEEKAPEFVTVAEVMPEFEGGQVGFLKYVGQHIKYPNRARAMGIEGKVFVEFIIDVDGSLTQVKILKGIGAGCDEETLRVINGAPKWKPGKQRGVPVKVKMIVPVNFQLG